MSETLTRPAQLTPEQHRVLADGRVRLHDRHNVFSGFGKAVIDLTRAGLMSVAWKPGDPWATYTVTRAGRDAYVSYGPRHVPFRRPLNHS